MNRLNSRRSLWALPLGLRSMRQTWFCLLALSLLAKWATADGPQDVSWDRPPRRLENGPLASGTPVSWAMLVFSADGKILAGDGERLWEQRSEAQTRLLGRASSTPVELMQVWDLKTYRSTKVAIAFAKRSGRHVAVRLTDNGKAVYGHGQTNEFQEDVRTRRKGVPWGDNAKGKLAQEGEFYYWPAGEDRASAIAVEAPPTGVLLGSHLSSDAKNMLLAKPEGIQTFALQTLQTRPTQPGVPKMKYRVAKARGKLAAAPGTFHAPAFFSADGSCFIASDESGGMLVWDLKNRRVRCRIAAPDKGRVAIAALSADNRRLFIASSGRSPVHVFDAENGQEVGQGGAHSVAVAGMSVSADGESLAYCAGGRAYVYNFANQREIALPLDEPANISCIAISPDGLSVAGGANDAHDGTVRLWETSRPQEAPLAHKSEPAEPPLVPLGPRRVTVIGPKGESQAMWLVRLTPSEALLRKSHGGKLLRVSAANGKVTKIVADGVSWQLNATSHAYEGPTLTLPELQKIDVAAKPISSAEENLHLLLAARRRLSALVSLSEQPHSEEAVAALRDELEQCQRYLKDRPAPAPNVANIYAELLGATDDLMRSAATRQEALDALNKQMITVSHQRVEESNLRMLSVLIGTATVFMGTMTDQVYAGTVQHPSGGFRPVYQEVALFPGLLEAGVLHSFSDAAAFQQRQAEMQAVEQLGEAETDNVLRSALELRDNAITRVQELWRTVAKTDFAVEEDPADSVELPRPSSRRSADLQPLLDALAARTRRNRGRTNRDDPFDVADVLFVKSLVSDSPETDIDNAYRLAHEVTSLVSLVPPGEVYNTDRARLLLLAAAIAGRAVSYESGDSDLCQTYSEKAAFAVALLDRALALQPDDRSGQLGEQRAAALAQCGRVAEALEQGQEVVAKHPNSAGAHYLLARLECSAGDVRAGLDRLERAVMKLGLRDIAEIRRRPEFPKADPRFQSLTELKLRVAPQIDLANGGAVVVANEGVFPLYNVRFRLQYRGKNPPPGLPLFAPLENFGKHLQHLHDTPEEAKEAKRAAAKARVKGPMSLVVETALRSLGPGESYVLFTEPGVEVEYQFKTTKDGRKSKRWAGGKLIVTIPGQGTEEFVLETFFTGIF